MSFCRTRASTSWGGQGLLMGRSWQAGQGRAGGGVGELQPEVGSLRAAAWHRTRGSADHSTGSQTSWEKCGAGGRSRCPESGASSLDTKVEVARSYKGRQLPTSSPSLPRFPVTLLTAAHLQHLEVVAPPGAGQCGTLLLRQPACAGVEWGRGGQKWQERCLATVCSMLGEQRAWWRE